MALWGRRHGAARPEAAVEPQRPQQHRYHQQANDEGQGTPAPLTCVGGYRHARHASLVVQAGHCAALPFGLTPRLAASQDGASWVRNVSHL